MTFDLSSGPLQALCGLSARISQGEFISLLGPSGCGKSTVLRIIADILEPTAGSVSVLGVPPSEARRRRLFGIVFQQPVLLPWLSVEENVSLPLRIGKWELTHQPDASPEDLLKLVGLWEFRRARPYQLSGGMQQRVAIARALVSNPQILLMDEPFGALDAITRDRMNEELLRIWQQLRRTVIFVTHSISEAVYMSTRVLVMTPRPGRIRSVVDIALPYPRQPQMKDSTEFTSYTAVLRKALGEN